MEVLWEGDLNRSIRKLWEDNHNAIATLQQPENKNYEQEKAAH
ncbi:hypothetical protein TIFTF001_003643 [Ficus carica]|uniref:Uncharacterized protein n=1 Tax=Ficus carica TaxID=3494 RepID=A0AA87ZFX0_FICCA|nr:hypothetical protein TIFTF001_003643 [Ficus carica]